MNPSELPGAVPPRPYYPVLKGQKALVTGASSGIGKGIALCLARSGADVVVNYRSQGAEAEAIAAECRKAGVKAYAHQADVSDEKQILDMYAKMFKEFGTIDILINNSGIQVDAAFTEMTLDQWNKVIGVNLTGQFLCAREAVKEFKRRGVNPEVSVAAGKIICISSVHEVIPWAGHVNYAASKGGIYQLMKSLAQEVAPLKIRVNSICPGAIATPINTGAWDTPAALHDLMRLIPSKRIGQVEDIGRAAVWMASDDADYVQGISLFVDGGMTLYPGFEAGG